ncbi:hypothetical protein [Mesorhizobium sp. M0643]|uniref:hypothetical protein n=1 Tax=Mesorhizobium sp. M0643 TaxID=2956978 RepID=UPI0033382A46
MRVCVKALTLIWMLLGILAIAPRPAHAACDVPENSTLDKAASILFNCSSTMDLTSLPPGEKEFVANFSFPKTLPPVETPWRGIAFRVEPERYLRTLLAYGLKDNVPIDWRVEKGSQSWCHAPWFQDIRERIHGMTRERGSRLFELSEHQRSRAENWAIGFYNGVGCYGLGQVWADPARPKTKGFVFPPNTFAIKLLFTTAPISRVPYLTGSKTWNAAIGEHGSVKEMRLLQVDVAVKDPAAGALTGWIFGTFMYDAYAPGDDIWSKLVPVGLMWGNDPELTAKKYQEDGGAVQESWVNPAVAARFFPLPRHHLGLFGRLNGPVDNFNSACLACHARALDWGRGVPSEGPLFDEMNVLLPFAINPSDEEALRNYFRNREPTEPFVADTQSLDYSLQLAGGIFRFRGWVDMNFSAQAAETRDVPPYKFKEEKSGNAGAAPSKILPPTQDRSYVGPSPFSRGD